MYDSILGAEAQNEDYSLFHKKRYAFTRKVLKKISFFFSGIAVRIKH